MKHNTFLFWIFVISVFLGFIFFGLSKDQEIIGDAYQYDDIAWNLATGHGYSSYENGIYQPTNLREPGYVLMLSSIYKMFGHSIYAVYILQILLFSISAILVFFIARDTFNEQVGKYSAFLTAICPTLANYAVTFYSEAFFTFILVFAIYSTIKTKNTKSLKWYVITGLAVGFAALSKAIMIFFIIPVVFYLWLDNRRDIRIILPFLIFFIMVSSWIMRNYFMFGELNLANRGTSVLLVRAHKTEHSFQRIKETLVYTFSEYLGAKFFPKEGIKPKDFLFQEYHRVRGEYYDFIDQGKNDQDISRIMREKAFSIIKEHPIKYLMQTPMEFLKLMVFMHIPFLNDKDTIAKFQNFHNGAVFLSILRGVYKFSSFVIFFFLFLCLFARKICWEKEFIIIAIILYINLIYSMLGGYQRYTVPLIPFYFIYVSVALRCMLKGRICSQRRIF